MTSPLTPEALANLERLEKEATPGPWVATKMGSVWRGPLKEDSRGCTRGGTEEAFQLFEICPDNYEDAGDFSGDIDTDEQARSDEALIATTRNALPALLAAAREHAELESALTFMTGTDVALIGRPFGAQSIIALATSLGWNPAGPTHSKETK